MSIKRALKRQYSQLCQALPTSFFYFTYISILGDCAIMSPHRLLPPSPLLPSLPLLAPSLPLALTPFRLSPLLLLCLLHPPPLCFPHPPVSRPLPSPPPLVLREPVNLPLPGPLHGPPLHQALLLIPSLYAQRKSGYNAVALGLLGF
ncbi:hypothetical protein RUND412_008750, partial [Rhizina undulata]